MSTGLEAGWLRLAAPSILEVMEADSDATFRWVRWTHVAFMLSVAVYIWRGTQARISGVETALIDRQDVLWAARLAFAALSAYSLPAVEWVIRQRRTTKGPGYGWAGRLSPATQRAVSNQILRMAFAEAIGIYGLLLFEVGGHLADLFAFTAVPLIALAWYFPRRDQWNRTVDGFADGETWLE